MMIMAADTNKAMIFAAGLGTRLKPLTDSMPKALVPVDGKALVDHVMEKLQAAGFSDITVNVHHFADMLEEHLASCGVHISDERQSLLDTGGGVLHAEKSLRGAGHFLVHNVDILSNLDLASFVAACREDDLATLVVSRRESSRYLLFDEDNRLVGWTNVKTGEIKSPFGDIESASCRRYAFSGIHLMSDEVFDIMNNGEFPEKFSIVDFYLKVAARKTVRAYVPPYDFRLLDVGKLDSLDKASLFLKELAY